jgi:hypothetical protein
VVDGVAEPAAEVAGLCDQQAAPGLVDRQTATLMYAGRNRRSATRRKVPLTKSSNHNEWLSLRKQTRL